MSNGYGKGKYQQGYYADWEHRLLPGAGPQLDDFDSLKASSTVHHLKKTPPDKTEILPWREPVAPSESSDPSTSSDTNSAQGLLKEPDLREEGAAAGLIGSETLRDLLETCYDPANSTSITWTESTATITGISGQPAFDCFQNLEASYLHSRCHWQ